MAHSTAIIAPAKLDTLSFRRADGSRREVFYDDSASVGMLPRPVVSGTSVPGIGSDSVSRPGFHSGELDLSLGLDSGLFPGHRHRPVPLPRNVMRPFRADNDEPARNIFFLRASRQSVCRDGRDRSRCSECQQSVQAATPNKTNKTASTAPLPSPPSHQWFMMSPQRVFRDLVMSDVAEPLPPPVRDALLETFNASCQPPRPDTEKGKQRASPWPRQLLPSPPPSPKAASPLTPRPAPCTLGAPLPLTEFRYFTRLPFEVRRMIWEQALPTRVLLREDLGQTTYRGLRKVFRPAHHVHSIEELWRSDLFYVCAEARRVVEAFARDGTRAAAGAINTDRLAAQPMRPLMMTVSSRAKLRAGFDVLYYPWLGAAAARGQGGGRAIAPGPPRGVSGTGSPAPSFAPSAIASVYCSPSLYPSFNGPRDQDGSGPSWKSRFDGTVTGRIGRARNGNSSSPGNGCSAPLSIPTAPCPYGHWASQLRMLRVPVSTVALDAAWIDKAHPDTVAWAAGVDLSTSEDGAGEEAGPQLLAPPQPQPAAPLAPPKSLQLVVADIVVTVRIRLEQCPTAAQRQLLARHISAQPNAKTSFRRTHTGSRSSSSSGSARSTAADNHLLNINGMDFTALVDLYDDWRIEEILSLGSGSGSGCDGDAKSAARPVNKAAAHRCIACTRRAWEARSLPCSPSYWTSKFGPLLGSHLQQLCQPTILFSVVLSFDQQPSDEHCGR